MYSWHGRSKIFVDNVYILVLEGLRSHKSIGSDGLTLHKVDHGNRFANFHANSRDTAGWFPNGTDTSGNWDYVRTGSAPDSPTTLLIQSAAAGYRGGLHRQQRSSELCTQ